MWKKLKPLLILLSITLNIAFVAIWAAHAVPTHLRDWRGVAHEEGVWCPLHRQLGVTEAQWGEIEPQLVEFQKSARAQCAQVNRLRGELIDLVAAPEPDRNAIRAKQKEILAGQRRMQELVIEHLLTEKQLLTPEQQEQLFQMMRSQSGCAGHAPMTGGMRGRRGKGPMNRSSFGPKE